MTQHLLNIVNVYMRLDFGKQFMKSGIFLHVFNDISIYAKVFPEYFLASLEH